MRARVAELERQLERLDEAEQQALGARAQAQALLDNIPHVAWMKNLDGVFLAVNEPFARACGLSKLEVLGNTDREVWPLELAQRYMEDDRRVIESGEKIFVEELIAESTGTKWFETFKTPVRDSNGRPIGTVGLARDITERKRAEEERQLLERRMQETQKLESLGVLAGGIAHDFNNLLVGVLANAELAQAALSANCADEAAERVEDVRQAAIRAAELTNQMLAYSGKGHFDVRPMSLNDSVREIRQLLTASISKKATVHSTLADDLPAVEADRTQLHQLVMNLITNASDALGDNTGNIAIRTGVQVIEESLPDLYGPTTLAPGVYVYLEVEDDGCGMDVETRSRLFEPFFTTKFTGRGLGLSAVQGIVRGHAGGIVLASAPGRGTRFRVLLPSSTTSPVPVRAAGPARARPAARTGSLVLLVDDDARVRQVTALLLRSIGLEVLAVGSGREAIREFASRADEIKLVLLDVTMPDLNGEQVLRELRQIRPNLPVILASGYSEQEMRGRFTAEDMASFLQKPYAFELLHERVRALIG